MNPGLRCLLAFAGLALGAAAYAQTPPAPGGVVAADASGIVRFRLNTNPPQTLIKGQSIPLGARVTTGPGSRVVLRFPDGMTIALAQRSRLRIREFVYLPTDIGRSRVLLNLTDGNMSMAMGAIGERDPKLIQIQVGERSVDRAPVSARGNDVGLIILGTATMIEVTQGRVSLLDASTNRSYSLSAGERALVGADGLVQTGGPQQINERAGQNADGKTMLGRMNELRQLSSLPGARQTTISAATVPADDTLEDLEPRRDSLIPPLQQPVTGIVPTAGTGGGGGGLPCGASCN